MEYLGNVIETLVFWFHINDMEQTIGKYCDFNSSLRCSDMDENAICNVHS